MSEERAYLKEIFTGYCLTLFSIFFSLNLETIGSFGWFPKGGRTFELLRLGLLMFSSPDFWYLLAGLIYLVFPIVFLSLFLFEYLKSRVQLTDMKSTFAELAFLTLAGLFPVPSLHLGRIFLTFGPMLDPVFELQEAYFTEVLNMNPRDWRPRQCPISQEVLETGYYSIVLILSYVALFLILDRISGKRLVTGGRMTKRDQSQSKMGSKRALYA